MWSSKTHKQVIETSKPIASHAFSAWKAMHPALYALLILFLLKGELASDMYNIRGFYSFFQADVREGEPMVSLWDILYIL